jgi:predicted ATP-grasp superfamily ATP-dependent carboligase
VIGCAQQLIEARSGRPYVYAGVIGPIALPASLAVWIERAVQSIAEAAGLAGLNGIDFLADSERASIVEINPRPSASVEVYDPFFARGLVDVHVDACAQGRLPDDRSLPLAPGPVRGTRIVFADRRLPLDHTRLDRLQALEFVADLPAAPQTIPAGTPLCSVTAVGDDAAAVERQLAARLRSVQALFEPPMEHDVDDRITAGNA